jgi:hypothetical protein
VRTVLTFVSDDTPCTLNFVAGVCTLTFVIDVARKTTSSRILTPSLTGQPSNTCTLRSGMRSGQSGPQKAVYRICRVWDWEDPLVRKMAGLSFLVKAHVLLSAHY